MLKQFLANQVQTAADLKNQQLATENLEKQVSQLAQAQNTRPQGGLPGDTDQNPKQVMAITLRSGKDLEKHLKSKIMRCKQS